jgi:hypothetical protein
VTKSSDSTTKNRISIRLHESTRKFITRCQIASLNRQEDLFINALTVLKEVCKKINEGHYLHFDKERTSIPYHFALERQPHNLQKLENPTNLVFDQDQHNFVNQSHEAIAKDLRVRVRLSEVLRAAVIVYEEIHVAFCEGYALYATHSTSKRTVKLFEFSGNCNCNVHILVSPERPNSENPKRRGDIRTLMNTMKQRIKHGEMATN